jgi:hypothetical protein
MQVLKLVPLIGSFMLHVAFVGPLLKRIMLSFATDVGRTIMSDVGNEIVFISQKIGKAFDNKV